MLVLDSFSKTLKISNPWFLQILLEIVGSKVIRNLSSLRIVCEWTILVDKIKYLFYLVKVWVKGLIKFKPNRPKKLFNKLLYINFKNPVLVFLKLNNSSI